MSFFRNLRSSITRGRSSSRDTTPVRNSRSGSIISSRNSNISKRRDSIESHNDSLLNRSETFILDQPDVTPCHSNCSTLEKKSKKSKVLEKFSTFTKRKKKPLSDGVTFEHHPSDNATNTYYKWQAEGGGNSLDYDSQNDPFNFLYEQQSSLKSLQNASDLLNSNSLPAQSSSSFDSATYRKSKMPTVLKKQLKIKKDLEINKQENKIKQNKIEPKNENVEPEDKSLEEVKEDPKADKYKTVTLNSFRRSFREKFLQQQKEAGYNPAWFVEVEPPEEASKNKRQPRDFSKENRRDLLVFENENYRPGSRSPVRDLNNRKEIRTSVRSPVKRNETFKVERSNRLDLSNNKLQTKGHNIASIHIEFKNSITPHIPGRMVPVGVAKPMPSQMPNTGNKHKIETGPLNNFQANKSFAGTTTTRLNNHSPVRTPWQKFQSPVRNANLKPTRVSRYQTLVQIKNEKPQHISPTTVRSSRLSTRIQLGGREGGSRSATSSHKDYKTEVLTMHAPSFGKRYNSSQTLNSSGNKTQPLKHTYFGDGSEQTAIITQIPSSLSNSASGLRTRPVGTANYGGYKYHNTPSLFASASSLSTPASTTITTSPSYTRTPSHSVNNIQSSHSHSNSNLSYLKNYQQQQQQKQTRFLIASQRRSRSPVKVPWR